jgi:hypothetical protein
MLPDPPRTDGFYYRSDLQFLGIPLVCIAFGMDLDTGRILVARGIIAIGHLAVGVVAIGNLALGGIALGSAAAGGLAIGGAALGWVALGGLAIAGLLGVGGMAVGWYAIGGLALGAHVLGGTGNDPAVLRFLQNLLPFLGPK